MIESSITIGDWVLGGNEQLVISLRWVAAIFVGMILLEMIVLHLIWLISWPKAISASIILNLISAVAVILTWPEFGDKGCLLFPIFGGALAFAIIRKPFPWWYGLLGFGSFLIGISIYISAPGLIIKLGKFEEIAYFDLSLFVILGVGLVAEGWSAGWFMKGPDKLKGLLWANFLKYFLITLIMTAVLILRNQ